jgi:hypothetical protein
VVSGHPAVVRPLFEPIGSNPSVEMLVIRALEHRAATRAFSPAVGRQVSRLTDEPASIQGAFIVAAYWTKSARASSSLTSLVQGRGSVSIVLDWDAETRQIPQQHWTMKCSTRT